MSILPGAQSQANLTAVQLDVGSSPHSGLKELDRKIKNIVKQAGVGVKFRLTLNLDQYFISPKPALTRRG